MEESYVSFDTAKLLKEAGFDVPCFNQYTERGTIWHCDCPENFNKSQCATSCPTQALAARWLREAHGIHVCIDVNASGWYYDLCKSDNGTHILWSSYQGPNDGGEWDSYEGALEAGLKICLELIKKQGL
ncbi:hypothetical protein H6D15_02805 [Mediterranea massiliensis]|uniref:Uncharacterized protein n=1 Tax=Caecibacteroides pullorum TaxID=2725562 RepID=A0AA40ZRC7_9BACT|nr:hypothetical protein [Caecibacteroides pullorum]MBV8057549.1 hypothetical protein [Caecibacteroides pullorum]